MNKSASKGNPLALLPIVVFLVLFVGSGIITGDFYKMPVLVAFMIASGVALLFNKDEKFDTKMDIFCKAAGDPNIVLMLVIFLLAGAFGSVAKNIFLTVLCINSDYLPCIIYRLFMELYIFIVPIVPAFGPYISSVIGILFPILLCVMVLNIVRKKIIEAPNKRTISRYINLAITIILIIIVLLNSGFFKYQMFTIGSNSMQTFMSKGDIILVKKLNDKEIKDIQKGQILVFRYKKKIISHRVYSIIKREDGTYYKTKGDNNAQVDDNIVKKNDVIGITVLRIKYLGIPSVKLQELFR